jgi:hypothetical protein
VTQPEGTPKQKIIVDEDWKTQVEREREELRQKELEPEQAQPQEPEQAQPHAAQRQSAEEAQLPPASFSSLVSTLATQAMIALGQLAESPDDHPPLQLGLARHLIDTLEVLEEKTKGNLSSAETTLLTSALHQLRMVYVAVKGQHK